MYVLFETANIHIFKLAILLVLPAFFNKELSEIYGHFTTGCDHQS